jgi:hypothetical protein
MTETEVDMTSKSNGWSHEAVEASPGTNATGVDGGRPPRARSGATRSGLVAALGAVLLVAPVTAVAASPQGYEEQEQNAGRFYGDFEGVLLFTYDATTCDVADEPVVTARVYPREDGGSELKVNLREMPIYLYHSTLEAPDFAAQMCLASSDGDPSTVPVPPFATGVAGYKERISRAPDGYEDHVNGVNGFATGEDGTVWKVRTWADFGIDTEGNLVGDPREFVGLSIHPAGP